MAAEPAARRIGLIIVGDEILSGRRQDKHFSKVVELLSARGMQLGWAEFLPDDRDALTAAYRRSFASGDVVLSCGGIGGTPDDHTRQAAAAAGPAAGAASRSGGSHCAAHRRDGGQGAGHGRHEHAREPAAPADGRVPARLRDRAESLQPHSRLLHPRPHVRSGLSRHGLAHARMDAGHALSCNAASAQPCRAFFLVFRMPESRITPAMQAVESRWPGVRAFSLPSVGEAGGAPHIDLGVKGEPEAAAQALAFLRAEVLRLGGKLERRPRPELDEGLNKRGDPFIQFKTHCQMPR